MRYAVNVEFDFAKIEHGRLGLRIISAETLQRHQVLARNFRCAFHLDSDKTGFAIIDEVHFVAAFGTPIIEAIIAFSVCTPSAQMLRHQAFECAAINFFWSVEIENNSRQEG